MSQLALFPSLAAPAASMTDSAANMAGRAEQGPPQVISEDLRQIAYKQRVLLIGIAAHLVCLVLRFLLDKPFIYVVLPIDIAAGVVAGIYLILLTLRLYGLKMAIILGILATLPLPVVSLVPLLIVNIRATRMLRDNGIQVDLWGARLG